MKMDLNVKEKREVLVLVFIRIMSLILGYTYKENGNLNVKALLSFKNLHDNQR